MDSTCIEEAYLIPAAVTTISRQTCHNPYSFEEKLRQLIASSVCAIGFILCAIFALEHQTKAHSLRLFIYMQRK